MSYVGAQAETFCGTLRTAVAVFAHRMCTIWCKSQSQPLKCSSLTPHDAPELAKLQEESYVGGRLFEGTLVIGLILRSL